ncbi:MAG: alpha/beta fold hydrolase [Acidimicrobiales bacterium]
MASTIDHGTTRDGLIQLRRRWRAPGAARAAVLLLHGIAEHSGRYEHVGDQMAAAGFEVVAIDHRGYGRSGGRRGHVERWSDFLDDVEDQLEQVRSLGLPVVVLGPSMGGLVATTSGVDDLLVLSGPALGAQLSPRQRLMAGIAPLLRRVAPTAEIKEDGDPSLLATDPRVGAIFYEDPLRVPYPTLSLGAELMAAIERTRARVMRLSVPTYCLHGADDGLVPVEASEVLEGLPGVERRVLEGLRHEVFNEPGGPELVADVITWIDRHLE